jgi:sterol desaturase/sphingolipid hydroxylase (fatty acid hydroxylase superfamily)
MISLDGLHAITRSLTAIVRATGTDLVDSFKDPTSVISWQGALRFAIYGLVVLGLRLGFSQVDDRQRLFPRSVFLSRSTYQDVGLIVVAAFLLAIPATLWISVGDASNRLQSSVASIVKHALDALLGSRAVDQPAHPWLARAIRLTVVVLLVDFASYCYHNLMHRIPWLWEFHKVHHSAAVLTPLTSHRAHLGEGLFRTAVVMLVLGIATGAASHFGGDGAADIARGLSIYAYLFAYGLLLNHSHIWWSWGRAEYVFNSPAMHAVHHSRDPKHFNKNLGNLLSIWDVIFGTFYRTTRQPEPLELGVDDGFAWQSASQIQLFLRPFSAIAIRLRRSARTSQHDQVSE